MDYVFDSLGAHLTCAINVTEDKIGGARVPNSSCSSSKVRIPKHLLAAILRSNHFVRRNAFVSRRRAEQIQLLASDGCVYPDVAYVYWTHIFCIYGAEYSCHAAGLWMSNDQYVLWGEQKMLWTRS